MKYLSVAETAKKWQVSERSVRNYCAQGRVAGAVLNGKTWKIPQDAAKPQRSSKNKQARTLLAVLRFLLFYRKKRRRNTAAAFTIKRRLN